MTRGTPLASSNMAVDRETLAWAAQILGSRAATVRKGLREGGSPWLIEADGRKAVLRTGQPSQQEWFENEAAALRLAATGGDVPVAEVYATGRKGKTPLMLLEYLEGSSRIPREPDAARLRALGAVAARIHAIPPIPGMPERKSPISETDFAQLHREQGSTPLLDEAEAAIAGARPREEPVFVHGAVASLVDIYRARGIAMLPTLPAGSANAEEYKHALILAPPSASGSPWMRRFGEHRTGFCSGWMRVRGDRRRRGYDRGFVLSDHADWPSLLRTFRDTGARRILLTHGYTDAMTRYLQEQGMNAEALKTQYGAEE